MGIVMSCSKMGKQLPESDVEDGGRNEWDQKKTWQEKDNTKSFTEATKATYLGTCWEDLTTCLSPREKKHAVKNFIKHVA